MFVLCCSYKYRHFDFRLLPSRLGIVWVNSASPLGLSPVGFGLLPSRLGIVWVNSASPLGLSSVPAKRKLSSPHLSFGLLENVLILVSLRQSVSAVTGAQMIAYIQHTDWGRGLNRCHARYNLIMHGRAHWRVEMMDSRTIHRAICLLSNAKLIKMIL